MQQRWIILSLSAALAFADGAAVSARAQALDPGITLVAAKKHHARRSAPRESGYVACTFLGCTRIPPNCRPVTDYYSDGTPTGYDAVVCPNAKYYSRS